jgi:hypothetical protein
MQSRPVPLNDIFDDPDHVLRLIQDRAPYITMASYHGMQDQIGGARTEPFFRATFDDALFLENPRWREAARTAFSAEIVRPFRCILNINAPMNATGVHVDLPIFRGFGAPDVPVWLLMNMSYSGLFNDWMVPIASGLAWFYRGSGGAFVYWPDGPDRAPQIERAPLWNTGVMSDNEFMFHGVSPIGAEADRGRVKAAIRDSDRLFHLGGDAWEIGDGERPGLRLTSAELRISLLWKAYVFRDADHLASFEDPSMDLSIEQVVEVYLEDLARKGIAAKPPEDPFSDAGWRQALQAAYPQPLSPAAADQLH